MTSPVDLQGGSRLPCQAHQRPSGEANPALCIDSVFLHLSLQAWEKEQGGQGSEGVPKAGGEALVEGGSAVPLQVAPGGQFSLFALEISSHCLLSFRSPGSLSFPQGLCDFHSIVSGGDCCPVKFKAVLVIKILENIKTLENYLTLCLLLKIWEKSLFFSIKFRDLTKLYLKVSGLLILISAR